ncbi:MAG: type II toxin-antitoxin system HicB family antitoxin [Chloroflexi bacterium]|nr:type II toxin-antitoxin system HicB family antitoxin [Chloroflexota bacterium]
MDSKRRLTVILERDEDGWYVASVPELRGCHTQGDTLDEVMENIRDAARLCLEVEQEDDEVKMEFIGVHTIEV